MNTSRIDELRLTLFPFRLHTCKTASAALRIQAGIFIAVAPSRSTISDQERSPKKPLYNGHSRCPYARIWSFAGNIKRACLA